MKHYLILAGVALVGTMVGVMVATIVANHTAAKAPTSPATP